MDIISGNRKFISYAFPLFSSIHQAMPCDMLASEYWKNDEQIQCLSRGEWHMYTYTNNNVLCTGME